MKVLQRQLFSATSSHLTRHIYWPSDQFDVVKILIFKAQYHCHSLSSNIVVSNFFKYWQYSNSTENFSFLKALAMEIWLDKIKCTAIWYHV